MVQRIDHRIEKEPLHGTIQLKRRERSVRSDSGPPTTFLNWAVDPAYQRRSTVLIPCNESLSSGQILQLSDSESQTTSTQDSDCSSD